MSFRNSTPLSHSPFGCSDTLDGTNTPAGAMSTLTNLIPDPTTKNVFYCRPASVELTDFTGFSSPGFISVYRVVGTLVYGMIASAAHAGHDEPFIYDTVNMTFITISGVTALNTPSSPGTTGAWVPPTMALVGVYMVVTHPGFPGGAGNYFGWFDLTTPATPAWNAGNTSVHPLATAPVAVAQFSSRAYFALQGSVPAIVLSDPLNPLTVTNASQALTLGNNLPPTALVGLPLQTQLGGIVQSLIVFQAATNMQQITGDPTTTDLAINSLNIATGTFAPNTITPTPYGVAFVSPQGLRVINFQAQVSDPIGTAGEGITVPFIYSEVPSRMCGAYNNDVMRITTKNASAIGTPYQEWWYHSARKTWTGPHTSTCDLIQPYLNSFITTLHGTTHKLFQSDSVQGLSPVFVENGSQLAWVWNTCLLPDTGSMNNNALNETLIRMQYDNALGSFTVGALNENQTVINSITITPTGTQSIWGQFVWGIDVWGGSQFNFAPRQIPWTIPIVFECLSIKANGNSAPNFRIGNLWMRYEALGYLQIGQQM